MPFGSGSGSTGAGGSQSNSSSQNSSGHQSNTGGQNSSGGGGSAGSGASSSLAQGAVEYMKNLPASWCHGIRQALAPGVSGAGANSHQSSSGAGTGSGPNASQIGGGGFPKGSGHGGGGHQSASGDDGRSRQNAFYKDGTENENPFPVIYNPNVPDSGAGHTDLHFFATLGNPKLEQGSREQKAEQEYILQNMPKGALYEAAQIADKNHIGIAVRGTGLAAHQGIEAGNPTKAQEFKNKTSKELDLWLSDELTFGDVGAVVHYDPRVGWRSSGSTLPPPMKKTQQNKDAWDAWAESEWAKKRQYIETTRKLALMSDLTSVRPGSPPRLKFPSTDEEWGKLKDWFKSRLAEFAEEDPVYTDPNGHYADTVLLKGPFIHLKQRPDDHIYGDHDLFGFTNPGSNRLEHDSKIKNGLATQKELQDADTFQAQHGGIWNWNPQEDFHKGIKDKIVGAHSAPDGDPLVYVLPGGVVVAAFYEAPDKIIPVWDRPDAKKWLETTHSGKKLLARQT